MDKTSPIGITPERQDYSCLPARDQHKQESEGPARAGDRREGVGVETTHPQPLCQFPDPRADPGGGGASEVPGGAKGYLVEQKKAELALERSSQRADKNSCFVPAVEQHWLLHQKPSRRETAGSVAHRYSVTGRPL